MDSPWRTNKLSFDRKNRLHIILTERKTENVETATRIGTYFFFILKKKTSGASTEDGNEGLPLVDLELVGPKVGSKVVLRNQLRGIKTV